MKKFVLVFAMLFAISLVKVNASNVTVNKIAKKATAVQTQNQGVVTTQSAVNLPDLTAKVKPNKAKARTKAEKIKRPKTHKARKAKKVKKGSKAKTHNGHKAKRTPKNKK